MRANKGNFVGRITGVFSGTLGVLANVIVVLFVGLYLAFDPQTYLRGLKHLVPPRNRGRAEEVLSATYAALRGWLLGQMFSMLVVGTSTTTGLWLLGSPSPLALGLLAACLGFIPFIGPMLASVPAILLGLLDGPEQALYVMLLYLSVQTIESYLLTPLVQQRAVELPPSLTLTAMALMGVFAGGLGVALAAPLTAAILVLVKKLYVEDLLGDKYTT